MPRIRSLKPEALQHRKVGRLSDRAFRLWIGLITQADDDGRLTFDVDQLRFLVWGYHRDLGLEVVALALDELRALGLCRLYRDGDSLYLDLPSWKDHQVINKKTDSTLPKCKPDSIYYGSTPVALPEWYRSGTVALPERYRGIEGSEGSEGRKELALSRDASGPASALQGAPALRQEDPTPDQDNGHGPLSGSVAEFMAVVRRSAAAPDPEPT